MLVTRRQIEPDMFQQVNWCVFYWSSQFTLRQKTKKGLRPGFFRRQPSLQKANVYLMICGLEYRFTIITKFKQGVCADMKVSFTMMALLTFYVGLNLFICSFMKRVVNEFGITEALVD